MKNCKYLVLLVLSASFLMSQVGQVPAKKGAISPNASKKKGLIKAQGNNDLKSELINLENEFKDQHESIKSSYKQQILVLKKNKKSEVQELKENYNTRRVAIYKKYGVKPPKKGSASGDDSNSYKAPKKKNDNRNDSSTKKPLKPTRK